MAIPKKIHYCWFGQNPKPKLAEKCIKSWKKYCPDYEIIEWNENNFDISKAPLYVRQAYDLKKWAFVTDYVRLQVVHENGGIYLDTDVELKKNLDFLLEYKAYFGLESGKFIATGLGFGTEKGAKILLEIMEDYKDIPFLIDDKGNFDRTPCPARNTKAFLKYGLQQDDSMQVLGEGILILPTIYMCPISYMTGKMKKSKDTISIHWFSASWKDPKEEKKFRKGMRKRTRKREREEKRKKNKLKIKAFAKKIIGEKGYNFFKKIYRKFRPVQ